MLWYINEELQINVGSAPDISVRYLSLYLNEIQKEEILKKPFINNKELEVELFDFKKSKKYSFKIPEGYSWDGATIPKFFWRITGSKTDNKFLIASMVHDVLCENHHFVDNDRYFADKVFERLLFVSGVNDFTRWMMFHTVDNFQKFCGWKA